MIVTTYNPLESLLSLLYYVQTTTPSLQFCLRRPQSGNNVLKDPLLGFVATSALKANRPTDQLANRPNKWKAFVVLCSA